MRRHRNNELHLGDLHAAFPYLKGKKPPTLCVSKLNVTDYASSDIQKLLITCNNSLTIKGLLDTPTAATCPKGVTTGFACPNAAKPAPWKREVKNINTSNQFSKSSLLQLPHKNTWKLGPHNQED